MARRAKTIAPAEDMRQPAPAPMTVLETWDELFADQFRGKASWQPWRAFLAALFALPMNDEAFDLFRHHTERQSAPVQAFKEAAVVVGRRGGKSRILALVATYLAVFIDYTDRLAPGEVATVAVIAADRKQARSIFRYIEGFLDSRPMLRQLLLDRTADTLTLNNRVVIEIATASFRVTRGYTFAAVLADECAFWRDDTSANPDTEIVRAIRPGLMTLGGMLLIASSPYRKSGVLWNAFKRHFGRDSSRVLVWRGTTLEMNASIDPREIEAAYEDDPVAAAAEHGAEFRDDVAEFVSAVVIEGCTMPGRHELPPVPGATYVAFVDPSGGSADSMTLAIAHNDGDRAVLDAVRERKPPFSPQDVVADFALLLGTYGLTSVSGDRYGGEWPRERFQDADITYELSERTKVQIYGETLPLLNGGRVELLDLPRLASQLTGLERRVARGGRETIDHSPGSHDDLANAACGALLLAAKPNGSKIWERIAESEPIIWRY